MMTHDEAVALVSGVTFPEDEWIKRTAGTRDIWVCQKDQSLCIYVDLHDDSYLAPRFDDPVLGGQGYFFRIAVGSEVLENVRFAPVAGGPDATGGFRAMVPIPAEGENAVSVFQYAVARVVNESEPNLEFGMGAASLGIPAA